MRNRASFRHWLIGIAVTGVTIGHYAPIIASQAQDFLRGQLRSESIAPAPAYRPRPVPDPPQPVYAAAPAPRRSTYEPPQTYTPPARSSRGQAIATAPKKEPTIKELGYAYIESGVLGQADAIASDRHYRVYTFQGKASQPIEVRLIGSNDSRLGLDPAMFLFGPNGKEPLARRFSEYDSVRSSFMYMRLPEDGTYSIIVTSKQPKKIGRYSLALRDDRASYLLDQYGELSDRSPKLEQNNRPFESFEFRGRRDQFVNLRVDSTRAEFPPLVYMLNSKGKVVTTSRDDNSLYRVRVERTQLTEDDTYTIVVSSLRPESRGKFRVSVY
jgi:hypothetical protein